MENFSSLDLSKKLINTSSKRIMSQMNKSKGSDSEIAVVQNRKIPRFIKSDRESLYIEI